MSDPGEPPKNGEQEAPHPGGWVVFIFLAALGLSVIYHNVLDTSGPSLEWWAGVFGSALALFIAPGVITLIWWGIRKFDRTRATGPLRAWIALTGLFGALSIWAAWFEAYPPEYMTYTYQPDGCEFAIRFPGRPEKAEPSIYVFSEVQLTTRNSLLKAGCVGMDTANLKIEELLSLMQDYLAEDNNINYIRVGQFTENGAPVGIVRGSTYPEGRLSAIEYRLYIGDRSLLSTVTVGLLGDYPARDVIRFHKSIVRSNSMD